MGTKKPIISKGFNKFFNIEIEKDRKESFTNKDVVIHCAGIADPKQFSLKKIYEVNSELTKSLAYYAAKCGVKKFIFLSTSKVLGEFSKRNLLTIRLNPIQSAHMHGQNYLRK